MGETDPHWADAWLDDVVSGKQTMIQRPITTIDGTGGLAPVIAPQRRAACIWCS